jgi:hypothetical protein
VNQWCKCWLFCQWPMDTWGFDIFRPIFFMSTSTNPTLCHLHSASEPVQKVLGFGWLRFSELLF